MRLVTNLVTHPQMQPAKKTAAGLLYGLVLAVLAGCADYLPLSSGELEGEVTAAPADWSAVAAPNIIQFETNPAEPYSVNLWILGEGERLYVFAGDNYTTWIENIDADPAVRLLSEGKLYELTAVRVTDADEFEWFARRWEAKYGNRPRNENVGETWLMRLSSR